LGEVQRGVCIEGGEWGKRRGGKEERGRRCVDDRGD
jgi:hypothetical protein